MRGRMLHAVLIALALGTYGFRAVHGVPAGLALDKGHLFRNQSNQAAAAPLIEAGVLGGNTRRALIMSGEVHLNEWDRQVRKRGPLGADPNELLLAARSFLACRCESPASHQVWQGLGEVYDSVEWIGRERRALRPFAPPDSPWERVGRPGRAAIGLLRTAVDLAPNWFRTRDALALVLWNYALEGLAREAVRESARALPTYYRHPYRRYALPRWFAEEFADASREVLGQVPLYPLNDQLLELGKLERSLGEDERAAADLRRVVEAGGDPLRVGEASFQLGGTLLDLGQLEEAERYLDAAAEHPVFRPSALRALARLAERLGNQARALELLRRLRREVPDELWPCLEFADLARRMENWPAAIEALRWAKLKHADEPAPYVALAEVYLQQSDVAAAAAVAAELERAVGSDAPELAELKKKLAGGHAARTAG